MMEKGMRCLRVLVLADTEELPSGLDTESIGLIMGCGDLDPLLLLLAAEQCGHPPMVAVKGNHDSMAPFRYGIEPLHLKVFRHKGLSFGGFNGTWQYKPRGHNLYSQEQAAELLLHFPRVDVFVAHNSPAGIHERGDPAHTGFIGMRQYIHRARPAYFFHGHQHMNVESRLDRTRIVGVHKFRLVELRIPG